MLELAREVAAEVRGPESARRLLPPGRGRGSSVSSLVCYLTGPLARRPGRERALPGPLPERGAHRGPRHRPRLPPRHPREADPAGARALRAGALGAGRLLRHLQGARGAIRDLGKALGLPLGEVERFARAVDVYEASRDRTGIGWRRRWASCAPAPRAGARSPSCCRRSRGLPRHISQHPGGMVISTTAADRALPGAARGDGGAPDRAVGQGLVRGRRLPEDRPARARDALRGRALRRRDRAHPRRADRPLARPARRRPGLVRDPARRDHRRLPDREPGADADAPAHPAGGPRRPDRAGRAGAAGADPGRRRPSLHRAAQAPARGPLLRGPLRAPLARAGAAGHPRRDRLPGPGARGGDGAGRLLGRRGGGAAAGDEPQALPGGDGALPRAVRRGRDRARGLATRWPSGSSARSRASPASASPSPTRPRSACSPTSRPGCGSTTGPSCSARC